MRVVDVEAPMIYKAESNDDHAILVLDITKYFAQGSTALIPQGDAMLTWRWVRHPRADLTKIYTQQHKLGQRFPYVPWPYVIQELP